MADDIFLPPEPAIVTPKLRWHEIILANPVAGRPYLQALAEKVPTINGVYTGGPRERMSNNDIEIAFDPGDPRHVQLVTLVDELIKERYAAPKIPVDE